MPRVWGHPGLLGGPQQWLAPSRHCQGRATHTGEVSPALRHCQLSCGHSLRASEGRTCFPWTHGKGGSKMVLRAQGVRLWAPGEGPVTPRDRGRPNSRTDRNTEGMHWLSYSRESQPHAGTHTYTHTHTRSQVPWGEASHTHTHTHTCPGESQHSHTLTSGLQGLSVPLSEHSL